MSLINTFFVVYIILLLAVSVAGFSRYKKLSKAFQLLTIAILSTLISESVKRIYGMITRNSMPIAHLWAVIEFAFFSLVYYCLLTSRAAKKATIVLMISMVVLEVVNLFCFEKITQFPSIILEASHICYVIYALLVFRQMLLYPAQQSLFKQSIFWFNINMLFYATTMFLCFALLSYFVENKFDVNPLVYFSIVENCLFYILIGVPLLIDNKNNNIIANRNG